jgi:hypothetical protein
MNIYKAASGFTAYNAKISWIVFVSICLFTLGSWIDISGVWCELPLLVHELPEGWRLPGILNGLSQLAQIGPLLYSFARWYSPKKFTVVRAIYLVLLVGIVSSLLLSFLWKVIYHNRSVMLYILNFFLSVLGNL